MKKNFIYTLAAVAGMAAAMVSCADEDIITVETPAEQQREITVNLVQGDQTRTYIDVDDGSLHWLPGDEVMYWTCATASDNAADWGESKTATVSNGTFTATASEGHNYIRVVYPSTGEGKPYAAPTVKQYQNYDTQWLNSISTQAAASGIDPLQLAGKYLPMQTDIEAIPASNVVNAPYTVLGSVILFKVSAPDNLTLKAVKAGDYQADFDYRGANIGGETIDDLPLNDCMACVVVPLGTDIEYTPTVFCKEWSSSTEFTCQTYTRNAEKKATFTTPKVQRLTIDLNTKADQYTKTAGWKKATDLGLSVAWADLSYGCTNPIDVNLVRHPGSEDLAENDAWAAEQWGEGWRLPTNAEWNELAALDRSTKTWYDNGYKDYLVISNNGASITFAAYGGYWNYNVDSVRDSDYGQYWSADKNNTYTTTGWCVFRIMGTSFSTTNQRVFAGYLRNIRLVRDIKSVESTVQDPNTPNTGLVDNGNGTGTLNGHAWVDLGLTTSDGKRLVFATCNIGAENPQDFGKYFWWGDVIGYELDASNNTTFTFNAKNTSIETMNKTINTLQSTGWIDVDNNLTPEHDAATVQWGEGWRMMRKDEVSKLETLTGSEFYVGTVDGKKYSGNGTYAGNSIFIPRAGDVEDTSLKNSNMHLYWTATASTDYGNTTAWRYQSNSAVNGNRWNGYPIRPVAVIE